MSRHMKNKTRQPGGETGTEQSQGYYFSQQSRLALEPAFLIYILNYLQGFMILWDDISAEARMRG